VRHAVEVDPEVAVDDVDELVVVVVHTRRDAAVPRFSIKENRPCVSSAPALTLIHDRSGNVAALPTRPPRNLAPPDSVPPRAPTESAALVPLGSSSRQWCTRLRSRPAMVTIWSVNNGLL
jgi:hypothetical protein